MARKRAIDLPLRTTMCKTCPFRKGGWEHIRPLLEERALTEGTPICHSTGGPRFPLTKSEGPRSICRGARNFQLTVFHRLGVIEAPTDEAWQALAGEMGLVRQQKRG